MVDLSIAMLVYHRDLCSLPKVDSKTRPETSTSLPLPAEDGCLPQKIMASGFSLKGETPNPKKTLKNPIRKLGRHNQHDHFWDLKRSISLAQLNNPSCSQSRIQFIQQLEAFCASLLRSHVCRTTGWSRGTRGTARHRHVITSRGSKISISRTFLCCSVCAWDIF